MLAGQRNMEGEDSFVSEIAQQTRAYESLAKDQNNVLFRYSLGGGVKSSSGWEPLGPVDDLGNFGPELSFGARNCESRWMRRREWPSSSSLTAEPKAPIGFPTARPSRIAISIRSSSASSELGLKMN